MDLTKHRKFLILVAVAIPLVALAGYFFIENRKLKNNLQENNKRFLTKQERINRTKSLEISQDQKVAKKEAEESKVTELAEKKEVEVALEKQEISEKIENIEDCRESSFYCRQKISDAGLINYSGRYGYVARVEASEGQLERLEDLLEQWEDDLDDCDESIDEGDCEERVEEKIDDIEDDIKEIESLTDDANQEIAELLAGECSGYNEFCK